MSGLTASEGVRQIAEQPGTAEAAAADDHAVDSGLADHPQCVGGLPDVAIAEHRYGDVRLQRRNSLPVGLAGVRLLCRSAVQRNGRTAGFLGDPARIEEGLMIMVDADPSLDRDRYAVTCGRFDRGDQDHPEPVALVRQRRAAALPGDLGDRAAEVQIDMIDAVLVAENLSGLRHDRRIDAVQLDGPDPLPRIELEHRQRLAIPLHEPARGDHLADVKTRAVVQLLAPLARIALEPTYFVVARRRKACPLAPPQHGGARFQLFSAELPERRIGDPGHGREHHRRIDGDFADDE